MYFTNYHTHTNYCDGKNSCEQIVLKAIELGLSELGFSGHSYTFFDESYCMSLDNTKKYVQDISHLKEKYKDKIKILMGIEQDYYSEESTAGYDFVIGSVHYLLKNGEYIELDGSKKALINSVERHWDGDFYAFSKDYFETVSDVVNKTGCDIIGHIDLITKFNGDSSLFSPKNKKYLSYAQNAVERLAKTNALFEINTGAMSRGYLQNPYPSKEILEMIYKNSGNVILSSDCHDKDYLTYGFEKAKTLCNEVGIKITEKL